MYIKKKSMLWAALFAAVVLPVAAKAPPEEVAKLGKELTPVGAIRAANEDGSIPEWEPRPQNGPLKDFWPSYPDIEAEKPLFTITGANAGQYADKLTEGHKELLKRYPDSYLMNVYPTHRVANFPQEILDGSIVNAANAVMNGVDEPSGALPARNLPNLRKPPEPLGLERHDHPPMIHRPGDPSGALHVGIMRPFRFIPCWKTIRVAKTVATW